MSYYNPNCPLVDIQQADPVTGYVSFGTSKGDPNSTATIAGFFALECMLIDINGSGIYENVGTVAVPGWALITTGATP